MFDDCAVFAEHTVPVASERRKSIDRSDGMIHILDDKTHSEVIAAVVHPVRHLLKTGRGSLELRAK